MTEPREYDLDWFDDLSADGQERVQRWLGRIAHPVVVAVTLTDPRGLSGDLKVVEIDDDDEQYLRLLENVHWDDPFPEDAT